MVTPVSKNQLQHGSSRNDIFSALKFGNWNPMGDIMAMSIFYIQSVVSSHIKCNKMVPGRVKKDNKAVYDLRQVPMTHELLPQVHPVSHHMQFHIIKTEMTKIFH